MLLYLSLSSRETIKTRNYKNNFHLLWFYLGYFAGRFWLSSTNTARTTVTSNAASTSSSSTAFTPFYSTATIIVIATMIIIVVVGYWYYCYSNILLVFGVQLHVFEFFIGLATYSDALSLWLAESVYVSLCHTGDITLGNIYSIIKWAVSILYLPSHLMVYSRILFCPHTTFFCSCMYNCNYISSNLLNADI